MKVYVVIWYDYDGDCLKKSEVTVLGVFTNEKAANKLAEDYEHKGYSDDERCYGTRVDEMELDVIPKEIQGQIDEGW